MKPRVGWAAALLFVPFFAGQAFAQLGIVQGKVTDEQGEPIRDVEIRVESPAGRKYKLKTNKKGEFFHGGIKVGHSYRVIAEKDGYQPEFEDNVRPGRAGALSSLGVGTGGGRGRRQGPPGVINFIMKTGVSAAGMQRQLDDKVAATTHNKALELYGQGQYQEASDAFRQALEKAPNEYYIWANLANTYVQMKRWDQAIEAYEKAVELSPERGSLYRSLGTAYANSGNVEKAVEIFEKAASLSTDPRQAAMSYYNMGITFVNLGKNEQAVQALDKAVKANPEHAEAHYQLGIVLLGMNRIREATAHLEAYGKVSPNGPNAATAKSLVKELSSK